MKQTRQVPSTGRARPIIEQPGYVAPRYHSRIWGPLIFFLLLVILFLGIGVFGALSYLLHAPQGSSSRPVAIHVSAGDSVATIADDLYKRGIINNTLLFRIDAKLQNLQSKLKVGDYTLRSNMSIDQMIKALQVYHTPLISITIPEGKRSAEIAAILRQHGISATSFLREVHHPTIHLPVLADKPKRATLEGYLFPNTYEVPPHYSGKLFADLMVRQLNTEIGPGQRSYLRAHHRTIYGALTLASIVEREAKVEVERPIIAGVYMHRLRIGMFLDADPTVQYAVGKQGHWWPLLTSGQEDAGSPYNTYTHKGLPPGPICNAGLQSILAAIHPANTPYLYFVAKGHGRHAFATTLAQQTANQQKYQQQP